MLQWGPVVVTGISRAYIGKTMQDPWLQWGPVVVTGISVAAHGDGHPRGPASMGSGRGDRNQVGGFANCG